MHSTPEKVSPRFYVRDVPVHGDVILSPMAGFSDVPYRALCRAHGSAMQYTEFVPAEALLVKRNPLWRRLDAQPGERPLVFQIFGNDPRNLLMAAQRIEAMGPHIIDVNMGCSARRVSGRGAGAGMMLRPDAVAETFRLLSQHLSVPVSGKIRLGWDDTSRNYLEIARIMEENGAAMIAMHARTKMQQYGGQADWDAIARLKQSVGIPVVGNGDVVTAADIDQLKAYTGCDAVMVGRGAIGNPWIFSRLDRTEISIATLFATIRTHLREMLAYYGSPFGLILFRKHFRRYFKGTAAIGSRAIKPLLSKMLVTDSVDLFYSRLEELETRSNEMGSLGQLFYQSANGRLETPVRDKV